MNHSALLRFIFEIGHLRKIKHEGWRLCGVDDPESVADHSLRSAQIGYILATMEQYENPYEVSTMLVFHDIGECRIGDIHKVANAYIQADEKKAVMDQVSQLDSIKNDIIRLWEEMEGRSSRAGIIAKDSDLLEQAVTAKEYIEKGYDNAQDWIDNIAMHLKTDSAKDLLTSLKDMNSQSWWRGLKKL